MPKALTKYAKIVKLEAERRFYIRKAKESEIKIVQITEKLRLLFEG